MDGWMCLGDVTALIVSVCVKVNMYCTVLGLYSAT